MKGHKLRWLGFGLMASAGAGLLTLTAMMNPAFAYGITPDVAAPPVPDMTFVMGGSGLPIPSDAYINVVNGLYIQPNMPGTTPVGLFTPEGYYPLTGVKSLPLDTSVSQGVTILNDTIAPQIAAGELVGVFGYSQSAVIASLEMEQLQAAGVPPSAAQFVLIGDPMNPDGGVLERFAGLTIPSLGAHFYGATPADAFPTTVYTLEYDGYADYCQYPIDLACDLNAFAGIEFVHGNYGSPTPSEVAAAIRLPTTGGLTTYYMIPQENLPLLHLLREVPFIGNPLADLIQPDLTTIVNLGYGDPAYGWSQGPANVPTQFGLFPPLNDVTKAIGMLLPDTQQGITSFVSDITTGFSSGALSLPSILASVSATPGAMADPLVALSAAAADPASVLAPLDNIVNALASATATAYATLLPTADIVNALLTSLPLYDANLFVHSLLAGDPIGAIGLPIAADTGLLTLAGGFELDVIAAAARSIMDDLTSLIQF